MYKFCKGYLYGFGVMIAIYVLPLIGMIPQVLFRLSVGVVARIWYLNKQADKLTK